MKPPYYKLLVIDIDGTLVNRQGEISAENREALALASQAGILVSLSTGRSAKSCQPIIERLSLDGYHIFFDGALVSRHISGEVLQVSNMDSGLVKRMVELASGATLPCFWASRASRKTFLRSCLS